MIEVKTQEKRSTRVAKFARRAGMVSVLTAQGYLVADTLTQMAATTISAYKHGGVGTLAEHVLDIPFLPSIPSHMPSTEWGAASYGLELIAIGAVAYLQARRYNRKSQKETPSED